jgi:hypothetical protein
MAGRAGLVVLALGPVALTAMLALLYLRIVRAALSPHRARCSISASCALLYLRIVRAALSPHRAYYIPAMVALESLMVAQYLFWARRFGYERTTWQCQQAEA